MEVAVRMESLSEGEPPLTVMIGQEIFHNVVVGNLMVFCCRSIFNGVPRHCYQKSEASQSAGA